MTKRSVLNPATLGVALTLTLLMTQSSSAALLLNYQFETVDGTAPDQTTVDSSGNYASSATANRLLGHGTNTPGTDYPVQLNSGNSPFPPLNPYVSNATLKSLNPQNAMLFPGNPATGNIASNAERIEIADGATGTDTNSIVGGSLDQAFTNFTISAWVAPISTDRDRFIAGKMGGSGQRGWQMASAAGTTNLSFDYFDAAGGTDRSLTVTGALPLNTWTHVLVAFDGANQTEAIYINNVLAGFTNTGASPTPFSTLNAANSAAFKVGHRGATGNTVGSWAGGIDDVRIYNETLAFTPTGSLTGTGSTLALVPEPSSCVLIAFGIIGLAASRRRNRAK